MERDVIYAVRSSMRRPKHGVVPGRREAAGPEPITPNLSNKVATQKDGFRAPE
jgi:hypothetical protein